MTGIPLAVALITAAAALLLRRTRWARPSLWASRFGYAVLVLQAPAYFLAKSGFTVSSPVCRWTFGIALATHSLTNYPHIILFTLFFLLTYVQLPGNPKAVIWSIAATLAMGLLVELAQGATGQGNCRMRDLIPDLAGALIGCVVVMAGRTLARR